MSALKSNMPGGTRLAALIAFALAACLCAWRANEFLNAHAERSAAQTPEQRQLAALVEPVLGNRSIRVAGHTAADGARTVLILVDAPAGRFHLDTERTGRIEAILAAATGFDPARDSLQIQPFVFAEGTAGGFSQAELIELGALAGLALLIAFAGLTRTGAEPLATIAEPAAPPRPGPQAESPRPVLRAVPVADQDTRDSDTNEARRFARENPGATARILRDWIRQDRAGGS